MELAGFRENLALLSQLFPGRAAIDVKECADVLGVNVKTVYAAIDRVHNPIPAIKVGKKTTIPIGRLARWMCVRK